METQKTLNGQTACFIASIAQALSRNITAERMQELILDPDELQRLLLPLANIEWIRLLPRWYGDSLVCLSAFEDIQNRQSGRIYTFRDVLEVAASRNFGFLPEYRARKLAEMLAVDHEKSRLPLFAHRFPHNLFPFVESGKIYVWGVNFETYQVECLDANKTCCHFNSRSSFYFVPGHPGSIKPEDF